MTDTETIAAYIAEVEQRADAAMKGPWKYEYMPGAHPNLFQHAIKVMRSDRPDEKRWTEAFAHNSDRNKANGELCAHARTDVPALVKVAKAALAYEKLTDTLESMTSERDYMKVCIAVEEARQVLRNALSDLSTILITGEKA